MEVPQQGHSSGISGAGFIGSVEVLHRIEEAILIVHQSFQGIGCAIGSGVVVGFLEGVCVGTEVGHLFF